MPPETVQSRRRVDTSQAVPNLAVRLPYPVVTLGVLPRETGDEVYV